MVEAATSEERKSMHYAHGSDPRSGAERRLWMLAAALVMAFLAVAVLGAGRASAAMEIKEFETSVSTTQAGGHPDVNYKVDWTTRADTQLPCNCEDARVIDMHFPTGFIGDPHSLPQCSLAEFGRAKCPPESQVGVLEMANGNIREAIYNMVPHTGEPGLVAFTVPLVHAPGFVVLHGRTGGDYGLDATSSPIYHPLVLHEIDVHLWGVPADPSHNANRFPPGKTEGIQCPPYPEGCFAPVESHVAPAPYLQNPTTCAVPLTAAMDVYYYQGFDAHAESPWPGTTGCDQLSFDPSLTALPTSKAGDTGSGLDIDLKVPQAESPTVPSPSEIHSVKVTLPPGFSLIPNAANGKVACEDSKLLFESEEEAQCPEFAKIGTASIDSSALPGPIPGNVYIGQPLPGNTFRMLVTADGYATHIKLKGTIRLDPSTGQVVTIFEDLPQSPLQEFSLHLFGSERGVFGTPTRCGSYPVESEFVPWDNALPNQTSTSFFSVDSGPGGDPCPGVTRPFHPRVHGGSSNNTAGVYTPFSVQLERSDGDQNLTGLTVTAPKGILASLRGIPYCPEAAIIRLADPVYTGQAELAASACPAASRVGSIAAGVGPGTRPLYVDGSVYLAGPYKGAPLSLELVVPAVSGPYDLGVVAVRAALHINPATAQVTATSDPLPQILEGVPLRMRYAQIRLDRQNFAVNPTNCDPFAIATTVTGDEGGSAALSDPFQAANCTDLTYHPKLSLNLTGGVNRRGHPALRAVYAQRPGEANSRVVRVALPRNELLDNAHIGTVCTRIQFVAETCPAGSLIGHAVAETPLLDKPLEGNVYLRSSSHELPDVVADLKGQIDIELDGRIDTPKGSGMRTTFASVPDAPVTKFVLDLQGGKRGLLVNSTGICKAREKASVTMGGQNGKEVAQRVPLNPSCGGKGSHKRAGGRLNRAREVR